MTMEATRTGDDATGAPGSGLDNSSVLVRRALGAVVVTVDGELDATGCNTLEEVLTDLIDGQGNVTVAVDLGSAILEPEALIVFITAARRARRHGGRFILKDPSAEAKAALKSAASADWGEVLPRQASG